MNSIVELVRLGGPVMIAIIALSVILYSRCFSLLLFLYRSQRRLHRDLELTEQTPARVRSLRSDLQETFYRQRHPIAAMITAAPLLGLLGTVTGMIGTFESLAQWGGQKSMEGLARGISEVLICTESGLAVAIPAVMTLYYAHRLLQKGLQRLVVLEGKFIGAS
ncbi:MAG TPA: MotA/TolQ/ExbB proton channel family protein [Opitutaceae bacterium]|nr:MotA/TolQ/ExbB proton channel family protein [Opitutaceae bacterium]